MNRKKYTTLQIDFATRSRLLEISKVHTRSMSSQVKWMIYQEWARIFGQVGGQEILDVQDLSGPADKTDIPLILTMPKEDRE
jgi:hypothetical protein